MLTLAYERDRRPSRVMLSRLTVFVKSIQHVSMLTLMEFRTLIFDELTFITGCWCKRETRYASSGHYEHRYNGLEDNESKVVWYHSQNQGASVAKVWEKAVEIGFNLSTSKLLHSL